MKKRIICVFLACVITFAGIDCKAQTVGPDQAVRKVMEEDIASVGKSSSADADGQVVTETESAAWEESQKQDAGENAGEETAEESGERSVEGESKDDMPDAEETGFSEWEDENLTEAETVALMETETAEPDETDVTESSEKDADGQISEEETESKERETESEESVSAEEERIGIYAVRSSDDVNAAVEEKIRSVQGTYPEGSVWGGSYDGGKQCFGFAMLMADKVFGCHPQNTLIRKALNGAVSNGWTCNYVNDGNCGSLPVEPGDIIDAPTSASASHTAMVLSVSGSNITCVQCNLSGNCKVYWTQRFNYNSKNATLSQIYSRFGGYGTIRLWKPGEEMKNAIAGSRVETDTEAPMVGEIVISSPNGVMTFSCTAMDNVGIVSAWAVVTKGSASQRIEATITGSAISGQWGGWIAGSEGKADITVYVQDAAGNVGSNSCTVDAENIMVVTPKLITIEVGETAEIVFSNQGAWVLESLDVSLVGETDGSMSLTYSDLRAKVLGLKPGAGSCEFWSYAVLYNPPGSEWQPAAMGYSLFSSKIHVIPKAPVLLSIDNLQYRHDRIHFTPVEFAETYDLYRMREGVDSDYQLIATFENDGSNSYTVEHSADGSTYYYRLAAKAAQITDNTKNPSELYYPTSRLSNIMTSTIAAFSPANAMAESVRDNEVDLTWDAVEDAYSYEIYRRTDESKKELLAKRNAFQTSYTDSDVDGGVRYYYEIYALDSIGERGMDASVSCVAKGVHEEETYYRVRLYTGCEERWCIYWEVKKGRCIDWLWTMEKTLEKEGYSLIGWYTKLDGKGERYTEQTPITSDIELFAFWREKSEAESGTFWVEPVGNQKYTGKAVRPAVRVYDGNTLLIQGTDYTVSYKNNVKVCDAEEAPVNKRPVVIVKGKKNYTDAVSVPFSIVPVDLGSDEISAEDMILSYTGKVQKPVPVLYYKGKRLKNKTDYTVSYPESLQNAGTYHILVTGKGGYTGTREVSCTITGKLLLSKASVGKIPAQVFSGTIKRPTLTVKYGKMLLQEDTAQDGSGDYTVRYVNSRNIGTATAIISAVEGSAYFGTKTVTFKITGTPISKASLSTIGNCTFSGYEVKPQVNLTAKERTDDGSMEMVRLSEGIDYTLSYQNNVNAGTAKVVIQGKGKYTGSRTASFRILPYDLSKLPEISEEKDEPGFFITVNDGKPVTYQKGKIQPPVTVGYLDYEENNGDLILRTHVLSEKDYKVTCKNTGSVSTIFGKKPQILISGRGNYKGNITSGAAKFEITRAGLEKMEAKATDVPYSEKAGAFAKTRVSLCDTGGKKLSAGTDYDKNFVYYSVTDYMVLNGVILDETASCDIEISNRTDFEAELAGADRGTSRTIMLLNKKRDILPAGQIICVKINAADRDTCNYEGTAYAFYRISSSDIGKCTVKVKGTFTYNKTGQVIGADNLTVTAGSGKTKRELVYGKDYLIDEKSYTDNVKTGTAKVTIYGIGSFCGEKKISFQIRAKRLFFF